MIKDQRGFTLAEILVVVSIILIILSIGVGVTWSMVKDSDVKDFVSNATNLEEASNLYFRDEGVLPYVGEEVKVEEDSIEVIKNELNKLKVPGAEDIVNKLIEGGHLKKINYLGLKEYTRITEGDTGTQSFVIVDKLEDPSVVGEWYENDLAGYVFSESVVTDSSDGRYSGHYLLEKDGEVDVVEVVDNPGDLKPYFFRVKSVKDKGNNIADVTFEWDDSWLFSGGEHEGERARGYSAGNFGINEGVDFNEDNTLVETGEEKEVTLADYTYVEGEVTFNLAGKNISFLGEALSDSGWTDHYSLDVDIQKFIDNSGDEVDVPETGGEGITEESGGDDYEDRDDLYKKYKELEVDHDNVTAEYEGLRIKGLPKDTKIVLKEIKKKGSGYDYDENRTRLFRVSEEKEEGILIPKVPYLQKDFQENPNSTYEYILEFYKKEQGSVEVPEHAVNVYYKQ